MIDPNKITDYTRDAWDMEEFLIFSICVADKRAERIATSVDKLLALPWCDPTFGYLHSIKKYCRNQGVERFAKVLHDCSITPHNQKADFLYSAARANLDLFTCSFEDLIGIKGVSHKTAHFFLTHSREGH